MSTPDPYLFVQEATRRHLAEHQCGAHTFEDGAALARLSAEHRPARVLELGTALGYTACRLAGASADTRVDTVEADQEHVRLARGLIAKAGLADRITVHHGTFREALPGLPGPYDLVFFDGYRPTAWVVQALRERLAPGGVLVCSNLKLARDEEAVRLRAELEDGAHWLAKPAIEGGDTWVRVKRT